MTTSDYTPKDVNRFWNKVNKDGSIPVHMPHLGKCWEWTAALNDAGYGHFGMRNKVFRANRVSWELAHGKIPDNLHVLHKCDNPACVNPSHLFLGDRFDNMHDMVNKGRGNAGEHHGMHKLTYNLVDEIRMLYETGQYTQTKLADMYGFCIGTINRVVRYKGWIK